MENENIADNVLNEPAWVVARVTTGKEDEVCETCGDMRSEIRKAQEIQGRMEKGDEAALFGLRLHGHG